MPGCTPIDFSNTGFNDIAHHLDMTSSPGYPYTYHGYSTTSDAIDLIQKDSKTINHFAKFLPSYAVRTPPVTISFRPGFLETADLDEKFKDRGVWAYPAAVKFLEARFGIPLLRRLKQHKNDSHYPVGHRLLKLIPMLTDYCTNSRDDYEALITDISKLDTCIGTHWLHFAFSIIRSWLNLNERDMNAFKFIEDYATYTPVLMPDGQEYRFIGGNPSGTFFTQLIDTIVTMHLMLFVRLKLGADLKELRKKFFCIGDDVCATIPVHIPTEHVQRELHQLGFVINTAKVMRGKDTRALFFFDLCEEGRQILASNP